VCGRSENHLLLCFADECVVNTTACRCDDELAEVNCTCEPGYHLNNDTFLCTKGNLKYTLTMYNSQLATSLTATRNSHAIWDHSVTCHPAKVGFPPLPPAEAGIRFSDPGGMQGWVDLCYVRAEQPGIEPATCQSHVQRPTAEPPRNARECLGPVGAVRA